MMPCFFVMSDTVLNSHDPPRPAFCDFKKYVNTNIDITIKSDRKATSSPALSEAKVAIPHSPSHSCSQDNDFLLVISCHLDPRFIEAGCECTIHVCNDFVLACNCCGFMSVNVNINVNILFMNFLTNFSLLFPLKALTVTVRIHQDAQLERKNFSETCKTKENWKRRWWKWGRRRTWKDCNNWKQRWWRWGRRRTCRGDCGEKWCCFSCD